MTDGLTDAWRATAAALPVGWRLDGLRCTSTGLDPARRDDAWRAIAVGEDGQSVEAIAGDPIQALAGLLEAVRG